MLSFIQFSVHAAEPAASNDSKTTKEKSEHKSESLLNKLFAPGPLMSGHIELEKVDCLKCHDAGKGIPDSKCLDCHKEIKPYISNKRGFHGRSTKSCKECHTDHKGRNADTVAVNEEKFDHSTTGFKIEGKHKPLKCQECHTDKRSKKSLRPTDIRFFGLSETCVSCHKKDNIHFFPGKWAQKDCAICHVDRSWKEVANFNHAKETDYPLRGKHAKISCNKCHVPNKNPKLAKYEWPELKASQCLSCHKDVHGKNLSKRFQGGRCDKCHNETKWEMPEFAHKVTGYPLREKHADIKCEECHKQQPPILKLGHKAFNWTGLNKDCLSCHKDYHRYMTFKSKNFKNPNDCLVCHNERDWKKTHDFNHSRQTRFAIDGKHDELKCNDCHKHENNIKSLGFKNLKMPQRFGAVPGLYIWKELPSKTCETCHNNPHLKTFSKKYLVKKCTECHITTGWDQKPRDFSKSFDHNKTRFALTGKHTKVKCATCHVVSGHQVFQFKNFEAKFCITCHKNPHTEQFHEKFSNKTCFDCHDTNGFSKQRPFEHDQTQFALKGKHKDLQCIACHKAVSVSEVYKKKVTWHRFKFDNLDLKECISCHKDYHAGQLDSSCNKCHSETAWNKVKFDHNKDSVFALEGKHEKAECKKCHVTSKTQFVIFGPQKKKFGLTNYKPISTECLNCHSKDDVHKGNFGSRCNNCHSAKNWKSVKDFHRNFTLHGVHFTVTCNECHRDDRQLAGMSDNCILCHQKDDIHSGTLPKCGDCHRQQFWEYASFRHSMTNFPLRGTHRSLDCFECHDTGLYQGVSNSCFTCHTSGKPGVTGVINTIFDHSGVLTTRQECNRCHNQFVFKR